MGFLKNAGAIGLGAGIIGLVIHRVRKANREEEERRNTPIEYADGMTQETFEAIAFDAAKGIKRLAVQVDGPRVNGCVKSQSGLSKWSFTLDFNDYGHITGKCWTKTENNESIIPAVLKERMQEKLV
jgi:hypothetical protein